MSIKEMSLYPHILFFIFILKAYLLPFTFGNSPSSFLDVDCIRTIEYCRFEVPGII